MARVAICRMAPFFVTINTLPVVCCLQVRFAYIFSFSFSIMAVCASQDWTCSLVHSNHFVSWALNQTWILLSRNIASMTSFAVNILQRTCLAVRQVIFTFVLCYNKG